MLTLADQRKHVLLELPHVLYFPLDEVTCLARTDTVPDVGRRYLNRLSDLLFVVARCLNQAAGESDVLWHHDRRTGTR